MKHPSVLFPSPLTLHRGVRILAKQTRKISSGRRWTHLNQVLSLRVRYVCSFSPLKSALLFFHSQPPLTALSLTLIHHRRASHLSASVWGTFWHIHTAAVHITRQKFRQGGAIDLKGRTDIRERWSFMVHRSHLWRFDPSRKYMN